MDAVRAHLDAGKPVIGIRTTCHAFHLRGKKAPKGHDLWERFDPDVLGGNYTGHYGDDVYQIASPEEQGGGWK